MIYRVERWYSIEDGSGGLWEGGAAAEQIRKGEGSTMKNANRIPETFQTDAEYRQWMERWQQEAREATIEGVKRGFPSRISPASRAAATIRRWILW